MASSPELISRATAWLERLPAPWKRRRVWLAGMLALFLGANLPWHLDNYDQAKQAWVAYEIVQGGDWWFQHTPRGGMATKPPVMGWLSALARAAGLPWEFAWRLPALLAACALLGMMLRAGEKLWPGAGGFVAACAFGFNMLTPRLAGLVRTDMLLTLWISVCGLLILERALSGERWTAGARLAFGAAMTAALFTKGPVIYVFLLPGMLAYAWLAPAGRKGAVWSGWLSWLVPLGLFLGWGIAGLVTRPEFYEQIVVREFFSRFDQSLKSHERQQPVWFYFPHLFHKFLPWSVLAAAMPLLSSNVRRAVRGRPELLWVACWALGGLLAMTLVPSKRVDRIYPVIVPLALLVAGMAGACQCGGRIRRWCGAAIVAGVLVWGGYFGALVWLGHREDARGLVNFGRRVAASATEVAVVGGRDEGLAMYCGARGFVKAREAARLFKKEGHSLVVSERLLAHKALAGFSAEEAEFSSGLRPSGDNYLFFRARPPGPLPPREGPRSP